MSNDKKSNQKTVHFKSRRQRFVTCPHCWTDQRTERGFCFRCGAEFIYLDELEIRKMEPSR